MTPKPDEAHVWTDKELAALEKRIARVYKEARDSLDEVVKAYFESFSKRDEEMRALIGTEIGGKVWTEQDYKQWRLSQIGRGERYQALRERIAERMSKANETALAYVNDAAPGIYSLNRNYAAYTIEKVAGSVGFDLWDEQTVKRLIKDEPDLMPYYPKKKALKRGIDLKWGKQQITKSVTSGLLQGKSVGKIATDLQARVSEMNRASAVRAARTAVTAAQNGGRMASFTKAAQMGIKVQKRWVATKDGRTRHDHRRADGQIVDYDKPFTVGGHKIMFPGDGSMGAPPGELYNCRCRIVYGSDLSLEAEGRKMRVRDPKTGKNVVVDEMTYEQWERWVQSRSFGDIIGKRTPDGIEIKAVSAHSIDRGGERDVISKEVIDAITKPLHVYDAKTDELGRKSQRLIGEKASVTINPDTGNIITVWRTGKRQRRKYGGSE